MVLLMFTYIFDPHLDPVLQELSWSRHQNYERCRGWDGPYFYIAMKGRDPRDLTSISLFLSSKITKPDATRCHGARDCKRCPSTSL